MELTEKDVFEFEQYLNGQLSDSEVESFENRLKASSDFREVCSKHLQMIKLIEKAEEKNIESILPNPHKTQGRIIKLFIPISIAASLIIAISTVYFFAFKTDYEQLAISYYQPAITEDSGTRGIELKKEYTTSDIEATFNPSELLQIGNFFFEAKKYEYAEMAYEKGISISEPSYNNILKWHLALALLARKNNEEAKKILLKLKDENDFYKKDAVDKLLLEMK